MATPSIRQFVICIDNDGYRASLEKRKIYVSERDAKLEKKGLIRVIDESGDEYLFPKSLFKAVALPHALQKAVLAA